MKCKGRLDKEKATENDVRYLLFDSPSDALCLLEFNLILYRISMSHLSKRVLAIFNLRVYFDRFGQ